VSYKVQNDARRAALLKHGFDSRPPYPFAHVHDIPALPMEHNLMGALLDKELPVLIRQPAQFAGLAKIDVAYLQKHWQRNMTRKYHPEGRFTYFDQACNDGQYEFNPQHESGTGDPGPFLKQLLESPQEQTGLYMQNILKPE
jgi:hypothetical protein